MTENTEVSPRTEALHPMLPEATRLLKALSHPARLLICCQLRDREMSVGSIETTLGIKQPLLSRELAKLREAGLVKTRRESKVIFYRLASEEARSMIDAICSTLLGKEVSHPSEGRPLDTSAGGSVFARTYINQEGNHQ